jgi:hypothetical protein
MRNCGSGYGSYCFIIVHQKIKKYSLFILKRKEKDDLIPVWQYISFSGHKNGKVGSGSVKNIYASGQCCGSGMFIPDPGSWFYPSRIPDPKTATKERGEKNFLVKPLCSHKFHKIVNYFSFEVVKKKIWANFQRNIELFTKKIVKALKNMVLGSGIRDPGSGKNLFRIQGSKVTGSGSATLHPGHWLVDS